MTKYIQYILLTIFIGLSAGVVQAQEEEQQNIGTERVVIVKAYTPTISDAFKVKASPVFDDSITKNTKALRYSIFSVPVASTYTPVKGKAVSLEKAKRIPLFDNYATLGFGNFTSVLAEFYSNFQIDRTDNVGVYLHHNSSQGGIQDIQLDDKFYNTSLDLNYTSRTRDLAYGIEVGAEHQLYNWYGLPPLPVRTQEEIEAIDPAQSYFGAYVGGKLKLEDSFFKEASLRYRYFGDATSTVEHHIKAKPTFEIEVADELIKTDVIVDFLNGSYDTVIPNTTVDTYSILNLGVSPNLMVLRDNLTLKLGAAVYYSSDIENGENNFYIYPKISGSYRLSGDQAIAYGGIEGDLYQNSYRDAVQQNPYVSPNLSLTSTHNQYDAYLGIKGKLVNRVLYNLRGSYVAEDNKALFVNNAMSITPTEGYQYGNSFSYRYDDITTFKGFAEIKVELNRKFTLGINGTYYSYSTDREEEAWNLPEFEAGLNADYQITDKWYAGAQLFFVGERKDILNTTLVVTPQTVTVDSYIDANINVGYRFNDRLSAFIKGNNLLGDDYNKWNNYPVQGLQVMGGATYKFDF
ncbi:porin family protein [Aquimarina rhabdastrellae]